MSGLVATATDWLAATGAPNWLVLLAILTTPTQWARAARVRVGDVLDRLLPGARDESGQKD